MRRLMFLLSGMMLAVAAHVRALDWSTFTINQNPVPPNAIVSFSIGYPKGWKVFQDSNWRDDIYFDHPVGPSGENICIFLRPHSKENPPQLTMFTIFYGHDRPAKEAAESFAKGYAKKSLSAVKTAGGDSGWVLESERDFKIKIGSPPPIAEFSGSGPKVVWKPVSGPGTHDAVEKVVDRQYFFHSGSRGSIRIEIMTPANDSALRSELDTLVLKTLRFGGS